MTILYEAQDHRKKKKLDTRNRRMTFEHCKNTSVAKRSGAQTTYP